MRKPALTGTELIEAIEAGLTRGELSEARSKASPEESFRAGYKAGAQRVKRDPSTDPGDGDRRFGGDMASKFIYQDWEGGFMAAVQAAQERGDARRKFAPNRKKEWKPHLARAKKMGLAEVRSVEDPGPPGQRLSDFQRAASDLDEKIGEAFRAALTLKGMWDQHEEIHGDQRKMYDTVIRVMNDIGKTRTPAHNVAMKLKRYK